MAWYRFVIFYVPILLLVSNLMRLIIYLLLMGSASCGPQSSPNPRVSDGSPHVPGGPGPQQVPGGGGGAPNDGGKTGTPKGPNIVENLGLFGCEINQNQNYPVMRLLKNNVALTRKEVIEHLAAISVDGKSFKILLNRCITKLPNPPGNNSYQLQAPIITNATQNNPFYFVAIPTTVAAGYKIDTFNNYLYHCNPSPTGAKQSSEYDNRFWQMFAFNTTTKNFSTAALKSPTKLPHGAAIFKGGYGAPDPREIMVVPCPVDPTMLSPLNQPMAHIYSFTKFVDDATDDAKVNRLQSFWYAVGKTAERMFNNGNIQDLNATNSIGLYLSTHGTGVSYLHFRVETTDQHYGTVPELNKPVPSHTYYQNIFP